MLIHHILVMLFQSLLFKLFDLFLLINFVAKSLFSFVKDLRYFLFLFFDSQRTHELGFVDIKALI